MTYECPYCKRPVITHNREGVHDGPSIRPDVTSWCTGACESIIGLFDISDALIESKQTDKLPNLLARIKTEIEEILVSRDLNHKE
jgi:hypothetical protein